MRESTLPFRLHVSNEFWAYIPAVAGNVADELSNDEIATRAYSYWESRGCAGGSAEEDWHRAIKELKLERQNGN